MIDVALSSDSDVGGDSVYLNHARLSPCPRPVLTAMQSCLEQEFREGWLDEVQSMADTRAAIANLMCASDDEIAVTHSATHAFNVIVDGLDWSTGDNVVVTDLA